MVIIIVLNPFFFDGWIRAAALRIKIPWGEFDYGLRDYWQRLAGLGELGLESSSKSRVLLTSDVSVHHLDHFFKRPLVVSDPRLLRWRGFD